MCLWGPASACACSAATATPALRIRVRTQGQGSASCSRGGFGQFKAHRRQRTQVLQDLDNVVLHDMMTRCDSWIPYSASFGTRVPARMHAFLTTKASLWESRALLLYIFRKTMLVEAFNLQGATLPRKTIQEARKREAVAAGCFPSGSVRCSGFGFCFRLGALLADCQDLHEIIVGQGSAAIQHARALACLVADLFRQSALLVDQGPPLCAEPLDLVCGRVGPSVCEEVCQAFNCAPRRAGVRDLTGAVGVPVVLSSARPLGVCLGHGAAAAPDALLSAPAPLRRAAGNVRACHKRYVGPKRRVATGTPLARTYGTRSRKIGPPLEARCTGKFTSAGSTRCKGTVRPLGRTELNSAAVGLRGEAAVHCSAPRYSLT